MPKFGGATPADRPRARLVICNTMVHHELASSAYNERREACERAVALLSGPLDGARALRDVTQDQLKHFAALLPDPILRRARHIVSENARVLQAATALAAGDLAEFGWLMNESHRSLRDDYQVSCPELDLMVELARGAPGVYGARMTEAVLAAALSIWWKRTASKVSRRSSAKHTKTRPN